MRALIVLLIAFALPAPTAAQAPVVDSTAVAASIERLPVLDDEGNVIPEGMIQLKMRPAQWGIRRPLVGALVGLVLLAAVTNPGRDCDPYEPCSPRERFMRDTGPVLGLVVGTLIGLTVEDKSIDRWQAVELIRAERLAAKAGVSP